MNEMLKLSLLKRMPQHSDYDWINIDLGATRIGKIRALIEGNRITIFSMNIFHNFEGLGYGKKIINKFKSSFGTIIADRVRKTAVGFWEKMGFIKAENGNYIYQEWSAPDS